MAVSQYSHCAHDTAKLSVQARGALGGTALGARGAQAGAPADAQGYAAGALGAHDTGEWGARQGCAARALGAAWACCWAVGCALGALSLFLTRFDSVLFLSQFLDTVHEFGS